MDDDKIALTTPFEAGLQEIADAFGFECTSEINGKHLPVELVDKLMGIENESGAPRKVAAAIVNTAYHSGFLGAFNVGMFSETDAIDKAEALVRKQIKRAARRMRNALLSHVPDARETKKLGDELAQLRADRAGLEQEARHLHKLLNEARTTQKNLGGQITLQGSLDTEAQRIADTEFDTPKTEFFLQLADGLIPYTERVWYIALAVSELIYMPPHEAWMLGSERPAVELTPLGVQVAAELRRRRAKQRIESR